MAKKIVFILILFLLNSCGYTSTLKNNKNDFSIISIEIQDKNRISYKIKNSLSGYVGLKNKPKNYSIGIKSNTTNRITSKDSKGDPKTFELRILIDLSILENQIQYDTKFTKSFAYTNKSNKFDLKNYKDSITDSLIEKISIDINKYIMSLSE